MEQIPPSHQDLVQDTGSACASSAALMPDAAAKSTSVSFHTEGGHIRVKMETERVKDKAMRARPQVAILRMRPRDAHQRYIQLRKRVVEISEAGALDHMSGLSLKYRQRQWRPAEGQTRVIGRILPENVCAE